MKKLTTLLMTLLLMSATLWADETITVSANSSDISEGLDLKVVAKLFAEAENLEQFEAMLNNPDSAFCNLDLNGDGQVDYLRVVETGEGNKRLIVLQAILAKDIYQDVASIYVEKDEKNDVSVQVVGDEYVYGTNYIIEPVYVYRPLIYDWFWGGSWYAWHSPWYWGYYPGWWYAHSCWAHDWYWRHCFAFHRHHHWCSFRPGHHIHHGYHDLHHGVTRNDYAIHHPDHSFRNRNEGLTNARDIHPTHGTHRNTTTIEATPASRTYGSTHTATARTHGTLVAQPTQKETTGRSGNTITASRPTGSTSKSTGSASTNSTTKTTRTTGNIETATRSTGSTSKSTSSTSTASTTKTTRTTSMEGTTKTTRSTGSVSVTPTRSTNTSSSTRSTGSISTAKPTSSSSSSSSYRPSGSTSSGGRSSGTVAPSGGGNRGGGGSISRGGISPAPSGGASRGGGSTAPRK